MTWVLHFIFEPVENLGNHIKLAINLIPAAGSGRNLISFIEHYVHVHM